MNIGMLRAGFVLLLLAMLSGLFVSSLPIPRLGLSAHTAGITGGLLLLAVGAIWSQFTLSAVWRWMLMWSWILSGYANWLGCLVGAATGAGRTTPVAAAGLEGPDSAEAAVMLLLSCVVLASLVAVTLSLVGLRSGARPDSITG